MPIDRNKKIEPEISLDGGYCYCPVCGYFDLHPLDEQCPDCKQKLDWDWYYKLEHKNRAVK